MSPRQSVEGAISIERRSDGGGLLLLHRLPAKHVQFRIGFIQFQLALADTRHNSGTFERTERGRWRLLVA